MAVAVVSRDARLLRGVCAAVLATGECDTELAAWCVRMLTEPGAAERAVRAVANATEDRAGLGRLTGAR